MRNIRGFAVADDSPEGVADSIERLIRALEEADAIVIGAGAGLSTSAGMVYDGDRFRTYFHDFEKKYGFTDMYSGGFTRFETPEEQWAFWSRMIAVNRLVKAPGTAYADLFELVKDKDYFIITTNVDHQFQLTGFDKQRLFYTQGDYGLLQCPLPCHRSTYENEDTVRAMLAAQGYTFAEDGTLTPPDDREPAMAVPTDLLPTCPKCGRPMAMNLRSDNAFVEDEGWRAASKRYADYLFAHRSGKVVYLELGVGMNTPGIIKYPFWRYVGANKHATFACINLGMAAAPEEIADHCILIDADIQQTLAKLLER